MIRRPIFIVPTPLGGLTADTEAEGHPVENLARFDAIGLTWKSGSSGSTHWVAGEFASARPVDFCAVLAANAGSGTKIRLRLGTSGEEVTGDEAAYDSTALDFISPTPSPLPADGLYHSHLELDEPETASHFRIDISDHSGAFEAAMLVLGQKVEPARYYDFGYERGIADLGEGSFTNWGVFEEDPGIIIRTLDFAMSWLSEDEFEESFQPMLRELGTRGFVHVCFDPEATSRRQSKTYFGRLKKPPFVRGVRKPQTFALELSIESVI